MLKQELNLKLQQKLSPQQIQLMKLVQLPTVAFEQRVKEELEENPALDDQSSEYDDDYGGEQEEWDNQNDEYGDEQVIDTSDINIDDYLSDDDVPNYKTYTNNYSDDDEDKSVPYAQGESFIEFLTSQLYTYRLTSEQFQIGEFILGNIDDDGYMRRDIKSLVDDLAFSLNIYTSPEEVENLLLNYIQRMDPIGVGARDLQECLLIQLENKTQTQAVELAEKLINESFDAFTKKHYSKLMAKYDVDDNELRDAITEIERLNPKPGKSFSSSSKIIEQITPDFTININDGDLELTLNGRNVPELKISSAFAEMLDTYKKTENKSTQQKEAVMFVKQKLDSAKWFIDAVQQRRNTLLYTMEAIMKFQKEYFLTGDETKIKPMILKDISDRIGMDISTVSRVANSKYVDTPYGVKLVKDYFSEAMKNDQGEDVSTIEIKKILQNVIEEEDKVKPLPDDKLAEILKEKGYPIARRTVAKYREQLDIPVARMRKKI